MADIAREYLQAKVLRTLEPLCSMSADKLDELAKKSTVEEIPPGRIVFRQGEKDKRCIYLLSGTLELQITGNPNTELVKAKTIEAKYPIAQELPRPSTCRTKTNAVLMYVDSDLLEFLMDDSSSGLYEVTEIRVDEDPESDWMLRFLQSPAFLRLPTEKIQSLLVKIEEVPVKKGQVIIKQGDSDPWYYIVKQGKCVVARKPAPAAEEVRLAILGPGDGFGEEALITHGKRNATITMKEDGVLMRLSKQDFNELLVKPLMQFVQHQDMMAKVRAGAAILDVRTNKEFNENGIKGAQNIPVSMLRLKAQSLNATREHILYCNDGTQSAAAAFLLAQHGITCFVLAGGLNAQSKPFTAAPAVDELTLDTTPLPAMTAPAPTRVAAPQTPAFTPAAATNTGRFETTPRTLAPAKTQAERASEGEKISRTQQLRMDSDALRNQATRLAEKTSAAEAERKRAEAELRALQEETQRQREEMLANAKLAIAKEKERAEAEAARLKAEAEAARKRAEEELNRLRREAQEVAEREARVQAEYRQAEEQKRKAAQAAEEARRLAKLEAERAKQEADSIRQKAMDEVKQLRESLAAQRERQAAEEAAKRNATLEEARRRAEQALQQAAAAADESRRQAQLEAENIRRQALEEVQRMRANAEREAQLAARKQAEEQQRYQQHLEITRQRTIDEAHIQASNQADAIRRQAMDEAAQLRQEIEATRRAIESNNNQIASIEATEESSWFTQEADDEAAAAAEAARAAAEAARRAQEDAQRRRVAELTRRAAEQEEAARREREAEAQRQALEEARRTEQAAQARRAAEQQAITEEQARARAEALKERLKSQTIARQQPDEFLTQTGVGIKLSAAKMHVVKDKTVLEGEEDIFIFKAPSQRPPSREEAEALIKQAEQQMREQSRKELPAFDIEYADEAPSKPVAAKTADRSGFSASVISDLDQLTAYNKPARAGDEFDFTLPATGKTATKLSRRSRRRLYSLAASVVVMVTVSIIAVTRPTYMDPNLVASVTDKSSQDEPRGLASMRTAPVTPASSPAQDIATEKVTTETQVRNEAEEDFQRMLAKWRNEQKQTAAKPAAPVQP